MSRRCKNSVQLYDCFDFFKFSLLQRSAIGPYPVGIYALFFTDYEGVGNQPVSTKENEQFEVSWREWTVS